MVAVLVLASCDTQVDEADRLIYEKPAPVGKNVLLVDFTGQRCVNCPTANEEIEALQEQYGADTVVAVAMHSGPLGFHGTSRAVGLATDQGDEYFNQWGIEYQPQGVVDYLGRYDYTSWAAAVASQLKQKAVVNISASSSLDGSTLTGEVNIAGLDGDVNGRLQIWMVEDSITALQMMPSGEANRTYVHNHVFRASVNDPDGSPVSVTEGYQTTMPFSTTIDEKWVPSHLALVIFVYNESGVLQVIRHPIE